MILLSGKTFCQNIIYRTNGTILYVEVVSFDGHSITYRLPGDTSGRVFHLSTSVTDSLRYDNGETLKFMKTNLRVNKIKRNYIGIDLFNTCFVNPNISYERLSATGNTGVSLEILFNMNMPEYHSIYSFWGLFDNFYMNYDPFFFLVKAGFTYYPFDYTLTRTGTLRMFTGASLLVGQYPKEDYDPENVNYRKKTIGAVISWTVGTKIYLTDGFLIKADFELSVIPFLAFNSPEVGIVIGF
jgi:hypothetical protein